MTNSFINKCIDNKVLHMQGLSHKRGGGLVTGHIRGGEENIKDQRASNPSHLRTPTITTSLVDPSPASLSARTL